MCVAVYCSVLSALQCVAVCGVSGSSLQYVECVAVCCGILSVLQCVAVF